MQQSSQPSSSSGQHQLSVSSLTTTSGFTFPPLFSFPPFFTKQPNEQTWTHQQAQWISLILSYARFHKLHRIDISEEGTRIELFHNKLIDRRLQLPTLRLVVARMVAEGSAAYDSSGTSSKATPTGAWIYWKRPEEWANVIFDWIKEAGLGNSIMTFYELTEGGDLVHTTDFYKLPEPILRKALDVLVKSGKAQVFKGVGEEGDGVKFAAA
ncbi:hypothetical protein MNV49_007817 [Pseudohyphozyma bogoriensis]|nr:hypothetical protein MNV49_007817 [Pseudohyphozyma bogoriensis]